MSTQAKSGTARRNSARTCGRRSSEFSRCFPAPVPPVGGTCAPLLVSPAASCVLFCSGVKIVETRVGHFRDPATTTREQRESLHVTALSLNTPLVRAVHLDTCLVLSGVSQQKLLGADPRHQLGHWHVGGTISLPTTRDSTPSPSLFAAPLSRDSLSKFQNFLSSFSHPKLFARIFFAECLTPRTF